MSYITDIFDRLDLQQIREFLLHGVECMDLSVQSYEQRLESAENPVFEMISSKFPDRDEREKIEGDIYHYSSVTQNVYMEIGMRCGAILAVKLLTGPQREQ